ncbi:MAG: ubiquitin-conjugating enzyme E2 [Planctomycetales bacterium]|nr:ubiquitin-conjugating enzyme E2 [Planctomycetales bacterium]
MRESPRLRRLRSDRVALDKLQSESTIFQFSASGNPADFYQIRFTGRGLWRPQPTSNVQIHDRHEVHIKLGASYPRMMPEISWKTPIFHPNISASGVVCLGGYGTYWVPSLTLDELCTMLWDMIRFENYDEKSPYNREAAGWIKNQEEFRMPLDTRPLRDRLAGYAPRPAASPVFGKSIPAQATVSPSIARPRVEVNAAPYTLQPIGSVTRVDRPAPRPAPPTITLATPQDAGVTFLDTPRTSVIAEVVEATVVDNDGIVFIN